MDLKDVSSRLLIEALMLRQGSRSVNIDKDERYKLNIVGDDGSKDRYIRGEGTVLILEIKM